MDYHRFKSVLNHFLLPYAGGAFRPKFYNIDRICPALRALERAYPEIRAEADALLACRVAIPGYDQVNPPSTEIARNRRNHCRPLECVSAGTFRPWTGTE